MTKRHDFESGWVHTLKRGGHALAALGMMGTLAMGAAGCDTVALISFSETKFQTIHSSGFTPTADSCQGVGINGEMNVRYVLVNNKNFPIMKGDAVDNQSVELTSDAVTLSQSALMSIAPTACGSDDDCPTTGYTCSLAPGLDPAQAGNELKRCVAPDEGMEVVSGNSGVEFLSDTDNHQVFGLLMENAGSLGGWNLEETQHYWDRDGDGPRTPDDLPAGNAKIDDIASDPGSLRNGAVQTTYTAWNYARALAQDMNDRRTFFGLWSFNGTATPTSHVEEVAGDGHFWVDDGGLVQGAIGKYQNAQMGPSRANVYESIYAVIDSNYDTDAMTELGIQSPGSVDKVLVVFTDGYDDLRDQDNVSIDDVVSAAQTNNVRVFIIQLDSAPKQPDLVREDPEYWQFQDSNCSTDADCDKNYEVCRKPGTYYQYNSQDDIYTPLFEPDGKYCMPQRDQNGRVGPIADYARLACETEGGYMYVPSPDGISRSMTWTPYALDGLWQSKVKSTEIARGHVPDSGVVKVNTTMGVSVSGTNHNYPFSQLGDVSGTGSNATSDAFDTRSVVFTESSN